MILFCSNLRSLLCSNNTGIHNLSEIELEDIKVRCCFVTNKQRAEQLALVKSDIKACPDVKYPTGNWGPLQKCSNFVIN